MNRLSVTFTKKQLEYLVNEAKRLSISTGELVRRIIDRHRGE